MGSKFWKGTGEEVTFKMGYTRSLALLKKLVNVALHRTDKRTEILVHRFDNCGCRTYW
jgi:hypothetical protein